MGLTFRKSYNIFGKYLRLNVTKSGFGFSGGMRGLRLSLRKGVATMFAGLGIWRYRKSARISPKKNRKKVESIADIEQIQPPKKPEKPESYLEI